MNEPEDTVLNKIGQKDKYYLITQGLYRVVKSQKWEVGRWEPGAGEGRTGDLACNGVSVRFAR